MSYMDFRSDFLTEIESRLAAVNLTTSTNNELLASGALYKMAASVAEAEQIGASTLRTIQSMNAAQLQTWLGDVNNLAAFTLLVSTPSAFSAAVSTVSIRAAMFGSALAMNVIIEAPTALDYIFRNLTLAADFTSSTALTATSVPDMTGYSTPSGLVEASSGTSTRPAWKAFDKSIGGTEFWSAESGSIGEWIQYTFPTPVFVYKATLHGVDSTNQIKDFKIECKTPTGFIEVMTGSLLEQGSVPKDFSFYTSGKYQTWRITCLSTHGASYVRLDEAQFFGMS